MLVCEAAVPTPSEKADNLDIHIRLGFRWKASTSHVFECFQASLCFEFNLAHDAVRFFRKMLVTPLEVHFFMLEGAM